MIIFSKLIDTDLHFVRNCWAKAQPTPLNDLFRQALNLQHHFPINPFPGKQQTHQTIRNDSGVKRPPVVFTRPCQQGGGGGVEDKKAAPDLGNAAGMAHACGG